MRIFLILLIAIPSFGQSEMWKEYVNYDGKFRVLVPGDMEEITKEAETPVGTISVKTLLHKPSEESADNLAYIVSYYDFPEASIHSDSTALVEDFFKTTIEGTVNSLEGELLYATPVEMRNYPGRLWRIDDVDDDGKGTSIKTKVFLVGRRFYSIRTVSMKEKGLNPYIDKFLDSFYLVE
ncbi:MAG: hypothetical protein AAGG75_14890 [Bacteroidota bacterium]